MRWLDDSMDMSLSKLGETVKHREVWCASVHGVTRSDPVLSTRQNNSEGLEGKSLCSELRE